MAQINDLSGCVTKPIVAAHRGASFTAPENTIASVMLAWQQGAPMVECDIHLTKDNRVIVMHDPNTRRTSGVFLNIADTNSAELRKLDVGSWKDPNRYKNEKMPFLEELIDTIPPGRMLLIEVKCGDKVMPYLQKIIEQSGKETQLAIISFNLDVVAASKKMMPKIPAYYLIGTEIDKETNKPKGHSLDLTKIAREKGLDGLDLHYAGVTENFAKQVLASNLELYTWTVDDPNEAIRLKGLGITGITTNKPDLMLEVLK
ncbi:MAG: hypothetical protein A2Y10_20370 [Planctomycetes bacterium GWF2_41_51]|nr:MAG: hypothetical protein A2Y10_20370 [Planctomycetes bacterium GWF2_41_51]